MQAAPAKPSLRSFIATTKRARPTPEVTRTAYPAQENKPLEAPTPKCHIDRPKGRKGPVVTTKLTYEQRRRLHEVSRRREYELPLVEIEEVFFSIYSTEEIAGKRDKNGVILTPGISVCEVTNTEQFGPGSVNDPQMGPTDSNSLCATCSRDIVECPMHPGHVKLPKPYVHPLFIRETIAVLNIVCDSCGTMLLSRDEIRDQGLLRLSGPKLLFALEKASIGVSCRHTKEEGDRECLKNPTYKVSKSKATNRIFYEYIVKGEKEESIRTPEEILSIFENITQAQAELMGFKNGAHPKRLIMEVLMVIPPGARLPREVDGKMMNDPLTTMYIDIIRHVRILKDFISGKPSVRRKGERRKTKEVTLEDLENNLYERIKHFINNTDGWYAGGGQPFTSLLKIIQDKEGLVRQNMMGKRVNWSARTVLSPDPTIAFGELSVPAFMQSIMTPTVTVFKHNKAELQNLLRKGRITYITFSEKPDPNNPTAVQLAGSRSQVTERHKNEYVLQDGDKVERWMQDGDIVIANRQPTLHKYSFFSFRVVIRSQRTFGLHLAYTTPWNADFDGDEGNMHLLTVLASQAEASELMGVQHCLINAQSNKPTMGIVFNGPVLAMLLTRSGTAVLPADFHDAISYMTNREQIATLSNRLAKHNLPYIIPAQTGTRYYITRDDERIYLDYGPDQRLITPEGEEPTPDEIKEEAIIEDYYSGIALFSALLPEDLYYEGEGGVLIQDGVLINGVITRKHIGPERNSIIHVMVMSYPVERTQAFITDATFVLNRWGESLGFSIGLSSCITEDTAEIEKKINERFEEARLLISALGTRPDNPVEAEKYEEQVLAYVNAPIGAVGKIISEKMGPQNALNIAALSGAKGNIGNVVQIAGALGQQHISGHRIEAQMTEKSRISNYFLPGEETIEAHGCIMSSFLRGLSPAEMYVYHQACRHSMMGIALGTGESGFMQRKAVKSLQDMLLEYDFTVRNRTDKVIFQYLYGDDGFSPERLKMTRTKTEEFLSFFDATNLAGRINSRYGF